jgi:hypothetical protein
MARVPIYNLEWQEPPAPDDAIKQGILIQLQNHPGQWARITKDRSTTTLANEWLKLGAEARAVRNNLGTTPARYDIYARWPQSKPPTIARAILDEAKAKAAPPNGPARQAAAAGHALTPAPAGGGYLAARAARGISPEGNPV